MFNFSWFKSSKEEAPQNTWNADTLTMEQPSSPAAPVQHQQQPVVTDQPSSQEPMQMNLRGGGSGGVCCGICAGLACFECCEICC